MASASPSPPPTAAAKAPERSVLVYKAGDASRMTHRVVLPPSWEAFLRTVEAVLGVPHVGSITDDMDCRVANLEVIRDGDTLCIHASPSLVAAASTDSTSSLPPVAARSVPLIRRRSSQAMALATDSRQDIQDVHVLSTASVSDATVERFVSALDSGIVCLAQFDLPELTSPTRVYAVKMIYRSPAVEPATPSTTASTSGESVGAGIDDVVLRPITNGLERELHILSNLLPHDNVTRLWAHFVEDVPDSFLEHVPAAMRPRVCYKDAESGDERRHRCEFMVLEHHEKTLRQHIDELKAASQWPPAPATALQMIVDLLDAAVHLNTQFVCHLCLSLDSVLVTQAGRLVISQFYYAQKLSDEFMTKRVNAGASPGSSEDRICPDVLNACHAMGATGKVDVSFVGQTVWEVGVLAYEMLTGGHPLPGYPNKYGKPGSIMYSLSGVQPLPDTYPKALDTLLCSMLGFDAGRRPSLASVLFTAKDISNSLQGSDPTVNADLSGSTSAGGAGGGAGAGAGSGVGAGAGDAASAAAAIAGGMAVCVKTLEGKSEMVPVPAGATVIDLQRAAAAILEPEKEFEHHAWLLLHKGKQQPDAAPLRSLPEYSDDMVFHLVALQPDAGAADAAADGDDEWSVIGFHHDAKAHSLAVSSDSQTCSGHKWGSALLRTRSGSGFQRGKHCWAFKVVNKAQSGGVCIGVALQRFDATRKNVGAAPNSWGYSSSGKKSAGTPQFQPYSAGFAAGDVIMCELDLFANTLRFLKNGVDLGVAFTNMPRYGLLPAVCMGASGLPPGATPHVLELVRTRHEYESLLAGFDVPHAPGDEGLAGDLPRKEHYMFDPASCSSCVTLDGGHFSVTSTAWGSALLQYPRMKPGSGVHVFRFHIDAKTADGGVCIGVANQLFDSTIAMVGSTVNSWGYSSTGKMGDGHGKFVLYGEPYGSGDDVAVMVNTLAGTVSFSKNGESQGVAFRGLGTEALKPAVSLGGSASKPQQLTSMEMVNIFDADTRAGRLFVSHQGDVAKASSSGAVCMLHSGIAHGRHSWKFEVTEASSLEPMYIGIVNATTAKSGETLKPGLAPQLTHGLYYSSIGRKHAGNAAQAAFGSPYTKGGQIGVMLDMQSRELRFSKNGIGQGVAFQLNPGFVAIPSVVLGGRPSHPTTHTVATVPTIEFDRPPRTVTFDTSKRNMQVTLDTSLLRATASGWSSACLSTGPLDSGVHRFRFQITNKAPSGGICIGVVLTTFDITKKNVAAATGSWGYSSSGKKNNGVGSFTPFGLPYTTGDVVDMTVDVDKGVLSFAKNGVDQGVAYNDIKGQPVIPAVCLGGAAVPAAHVLTLVPLAPVEHVSERVCRFSEVWKHRTVQPSQDRMVVSMTTWGSVVMEHGGITKGRHEFKFLIEAKAPTGGICVGVVDNDHFDATSKNVGAAPDSWGFSSSGKKSAGSPQFEEYATPFKSGDIVGVLVDMDKPSISFTLNEVDLGVAFAGDSLKGKTLVPAVCGGGANPAAGQSHRIRILESPTGFAPQRTSSKLTVSNNNLTISGSEWGTALMQHTGITHGKHCWSVKIDRKASSGGICVGVVDVERFNPSLHTIGADTNSWGYSSLGVKGDGSGEWLTFGSKFGTGDIISVLLDMDAGTLSFSKNGSPQGVAFSEGIKNRRVMPGVTVGGSGRSNHSVTVLQANVAVVV